MQTFDETERRAYIENNQAVLVGMAAGIAETEDTMASQDDHKEVETERDVLDDLADKLGALICVLAENLRDSDTDANLRAKAGAQVCGVLSRDFGGFIDPRRYVAGNKADSIAALTRDVDELTDEVFHLLNN